MPGYAVTVTEKGDEWSKISSNGVEGYIKNEYLVFGEEAKAHYRNMCGITGVVQADSLRVREAASTDSAQVGTLTQNGEVSVFGEEADWYQIQYSGSSAYVHGDYVTLSEELKVPFPWRNTRHHRPVRQAAQQQLHSRQCIGNFRRQQ